MSCTRGPQFGWLPKFRTSGRKLHQRRWLSPVPLICIATFLAGCTVGQRHDVRPPSNTQASSAATQIVGTWLRIDDPYIRYTEDRWELFCADGRWFRTARHNISGRYSISGDVWCVTAPMMSPICRRFYRLPDGRVASSAPDSTGSHYALVVSSNPTTIAFPSCAE